MADNIIEINISELVKTIEVCLKNRIILPGLILLYSGIDIMAWLDRPVTHEDTTKSDFIKWIKKYMLPDSNLTCSAIDLYAARCSLLHSYTSESKLSRGGKAKQIYYAWGTANNKYLQEILNHSSKKNLVISIHINDLFNAFLSGVDKYTKALSNNRRIAFLVYKRAEKFFGNITFN